MSMRKTDTKPIRGERIYDFGKKFGTEYLSDSIHIDDFAAHVAKLHSDGDIGFANEYENIQAFCKETILVRLFKTNQDFKNIFSFINNDNFEYFTGET